MIFSPISNDLSKQGSIYDVERLFDIDNIFNRCNLTYDQLENLVANNSLAHKVVTYYPHRMANITLNIKTDRSVEDEIQVRRLDWIRSEIRKAPLAFKKAQIKANIFGESYLTYNIHSDGDDPTNWENNQHIGKSDPVNDDDFLYTDDIYNEIDFLEYSYVKYSKNIFTANSHIRLPKSGILLSRKFFRKLEDNIDLILNKNVHYSKHIKPIINKYDLIWLSNKEKLDNKLVEILSSHEELHNFINIWLENVDDPSMGHNFKIDEHFLLKHQYFHFKAFGYQENPNENDDPSTIRQNKRTIGEELKYKDNKPIISKSHNDGGYPIRHSYQLVRFVNPLLQFISFKNSILNRTQRAEFLHYKKEGLNEVLKRAAQEDRESINQRGTGFLQNFSSQQQERDRQMTELSEMLKSSVNLGIIMSDLTSELDVKQRNFQGIPETYKIFKDEVIAASGMTEYALFHLTDKGGGLASVDLNTRQFEASALENHFNSNWLQLVEDLLKNLIDYAEWDKDLNGELELLHKVPFNLTEDEKRKDLRDKLELRLELLNNNIISTAELRQELLSNQTEIGRLFGLDIELRDDDNTPTNVTELSTDGDLEDSDIQDGGLHSINSKDNNINSSPDSITSQSMDKFNISPTTEDNDLNDTLIV